MTNNETIDKIAKELERLNDLLELEFFLRHREWSNEKYSDRQKAIADIFCTQIDEKLNDSSYTYKK